MSRKTQKAEARLAREQVRDAALHLAARTDLLSIPDFLSLAEAIQSIEASLVDFEVQPWECLRGLTLVRSTPNCPYPGYMEVELRPQNSAGKEENPRNSPQFRFRDPVWIRFGPQEHEVVFAPVFSHAPGGSIRLRFQTLAAPPDFHRKLQDADGNLSVEPRPYLPDYTEIAEVLRGYHELRDLVSTRRADAALRQELSLHPSRAFLELFEGERSPEMPRPRSGFIPLNERLNPSQIQAIQHALATPDIHLIHGPPGTGQ